MKASRLISTKRNGPLPLISGEGGGAIAQSTEHTDSIPADAPSILVGSVSVRQKSWTPRYVSVWQHVEMSEVSVGTRPRHRLIPDDGRE